MKNLVATVLILVMSSFLMTGCGSSGTTYQADAQPATPEVPNTGGDAFVITSNGEGSAGMSYTNVGDGSILVDCGIGGCGDVYTAVGDNDNSGEAVDGGASTTSNPGTCPAGTIWCSIDNKCVPDGSSSSCSS